jgi:hypothetical protein
LADGAGAAAIVAALSAKYPAWNSVTPRALELHAKKPQGSSPGQKNRAKRHLSDEAEEAFGEVCRDACAAKSQHSMASLQKDVQSSLANTMELDRFKGGVVSKGFVQRLSDRLLQRGLVDKDAPTSETEDRLQWCTFENMDNYYKSVAKVAMSIKAAVANPSYNPKTPLSQMIVWKDPSRVGYADETDLPLNEKDRKGKKATKLVRAEMGRVANAARSSNGTWGVTLVRSSSMRRAVLG